MKNTNATCHDGFLEFAHGDLRYREQLKNFNMPLDIFLDDNSNNSKRQVSLFIEDYDIIMKKMDEAPDFPIIQRIFSDYYGENEVFLAELEHLLTELLSFKKLFGSATPLTTELLSDFINLVMLAIHKRKTIKIVGD
jgi:hypothetical protein